MSEHEQNQETIAWNEGANGALRNFRDDPRVTAYALGELEALDEDAVAAIADQIARDSELRQYVEDLRAAGDGLSAELSATESSSAKGGRLASAEEYMAAAFSARAEAHTQTVSAKPENPHAAAGSGRRAREASKIGPSPFRRSFALAAAAAMLVISVLVGLMVANYGAQNAATPVAADVQESVERGLKTYEGSYNGGSGFFGALPDKGKAPESVLDGALELQIGQFKDGEIVERIPEDQRDRMIEEYRDPELERFQNPVPTVAVVKDVLSSVSESAGADPNSGGIVYLPAKGPDAQPGPVLQRRNQKISELLEEVDRVTDENMRFGEERLDTKLSWAPEKLKSGLVYQQDRGANSQTVPFDSAHSFDLEIQGSPSTIDGTNRAIDGTIDSFQPGRAAVGLSQVAGEWVDGVPRGTKDEISRGMTRWPGNMPPVHDARNYQPGPSADAADDWQDTFGYPRYFYRNALDTGLTYSESPRRAGRPLGDSTVTADAKPEAEVAETKKETDLQQAEKLATLPDAVFTEKPGSVDEIRKQNATLKKDLEDLRQRLAQQKNKVPAINAPIGRADPLVENKYGPNAGVTTKDGALTMGGLVQTWFYTIHKENVAVGLSRVTGEWVNGTTGDSCGSGININDVYAPTYRVRRGEIGFNAMDFNNTNLNVAYGLYHGVTPHHDFHVFTGYRLTQQHWADQFRRDLPLDYFALAATGHTLLDDGLYSYYRPESMRGWRLKLDAGSRYGKHGATLEFRPTPAPEAPGGMVVWHFNAADPARGQTNDMWRLTRIGGRFSDLMSSLGDYQIGGAVKDGGLALVGVDGEFDHGRMGYVAPHPDEGRSTESYAVVTENPFEKARTISTFSIDVDTASYSNVRRWLNDNQLPPPGAVRYEELINYFRYAYEPPPSDAKEPFATHVEVATCPWNAAHRLVRIALKGREIDPNSRPSSNLVFLVDVSGSMGDPNKLDLVRQGLNLLVDNLNARDRVAIVTYSDKIKVELESTPCDQKRRILERINDLRADGSTNGGDGIQKAYAIAAKNHIAGGTNRVILCTDGDFNVGTTSNDELVKLIEQKAKGGVFLSVLGFGMGNYKDDKLEAIADKGNGHYAYIDSFQEAKKVFGQELAGTLVTIAKDVKVQVEFNPAAAHSYRLIGYENRLMRKEDFADDTKDAGEIGAGHTVTALYEVIPAGAEEAVQPVRVPLDVLLLNAKPEEVAKLAFLWKQTGGPKADLRDADRPNAYFLPTADGEYEFEVSAVANASVIKTTVKRTVKLAELAAPKAPAERASRYLEEAKVKEDAKTSGELLTVWLRYKQPEEDKSTELSVPVRDAGKKLEQSSQDFRFASSVAAFGMLLRGSVYAKALNWDFVLELAGESKGADAEAQSQRAEFIDLAKKAKALSGK